MTQSAAQKFAAAMTALGLDAAAPKIAVAVSGGGDSLALTLLLKDWCDTRGGELLALTVDHGLRAESAAEAATLHETLQTRGIAHDILLWQGEKPTTHIQERARDARYALLQTACRERGFPILALAHNAEDQMETFWMRLAHGSGLDGLAGMAPSREQNGLRLIRPLLGFSRAELRGICAGYGAAFVDDPSNANEKYLRPRLRGFEEMLAGEGLTPQRLAQVVQKLADARDALADTVQKTLQHLSSEHDAGFITLNPAAFAHEHPEIQRRLLIEILTRIAPQAYRPGSDAIEQLRHDLGASFTGRTLASCDIFPARGDVIFCREYADLPPAVEVHKGAIWDGRFTVENAPENESLALGALGDDGLAILRKCAAENKAGEVPLSAYPARLLRVFPALWQGQNLVAVPHLSWTAPNTCATPAQLRLRRFPA